MSQLVFVRRTPLTDAMLIASNVPENDYPVYDPLATYNTGVKVILLSDHRVYVSTADENTGNTPSLTSDKWASPGFTNRWNAFDESLSTVTFQDNLITYEIEPGKAVGGIAILGLIAALSVKVQIIDPVYGNVYEKEYNVGPQIQAPTWWDWFFGTRSISSTQSLFLDTPTYPNSKIYITITGTTGLGVGLIMFGQKMAFGYGVQYGARAGIVSYSTVQRDISGRASIRKRPYAKRSNLAVTISNDEIDLLYNFLGIIESEPVLMVATDTYEALTGFGLVKNFEVVIPNPGYSECAIEFDGMT